MRCHALDQIYIISKLIKNDKKVSDNNGYNLEMLFFIKHVRRGQGKEQHS